MPQKRGSSPVRAGKVRLRSFDWGPLVERGFFQGMITAYVGAGLGLILFDAQGMSAPNWLLVDVPLSLLCAALAFARVWKTIREENETSAQWDDIEQTGDDRAVDRFFEIPYLFALTVLPFSTIAPQAFMLTLAMFYFTDNFYNAGLARGAAELRSSGRTYSAALATGLRRAAVLLPRDMRDGDDNAMVRFFVTRSRYNTAFMVVLLVGAGVTSTLKIAGLDSQAWLFAILALGTVLFTELVVEPRRNIPDELWPED